MSLPLEIIGEVLELTPTVNKIFVDSIGVWKIHKDRYNPVRDIDSPYTIYCKIMSDNSSIVVLDKIIIHELEAFYMTRNYPSPDETRSHMMSMFGYKVQSAILALNGNYSDISPTGGILHMILYMEEYDIVESVIRGANVEELDKLKGSSATWTGMNIPPEFIKRFQNSPYLNNILDALGDAIACDLSRILTTKQLVEYKRHIWDEDRDRLWSLFYKSRYFALEGEKVSVVSARWLDIARRRDADLAIASMGSILPIHVYSDPMVYYAAAFVALHVLHDYGMFISLANELLQFYGRDMYDAISEHIHQFNIWPASVDKLPRAVVLAIVVRTGENRSGYREFDPPW